MKRNIWKIIQIIFMVLWAVIFLRSNFFPAVYIIAALFGIVCVFINKNLQISHEHNVVKTIFAIVLSVVICAANYGVYGSIFQNKFLIVLTAAAALFGGFAVFSNIIGWTAHIAIKKKWKSHEHKLRPAGVLFISAAILTLIYCLVLFICYYPGVVSADSLNQITQNMTGVYSNHHPVAHTLIIKAFMSLGMAVFGDINSAVATYSVFQILVMAFAAGYILMTMQEAKITYKLQVPVLIFFAVMPYHVVYSFTMWKDVLFGAAMAVFILDVFRIMNSIGKCRAANYIMLALSGIGVCLLRTNGLAAFAVLFIAAIFVLRKKFAKTLLILAAVLLAAVIVKYPVFTALNIPQADTIESLSIPAQQIGRVLADGGELTDEQRELLSNVVDVDKIAENYQWHTSEKLKELVRATDNQEYIKEHKMEFIKMYVQMALQHPAAFVEAWLDGTKGYYGGGEEMFNWTEVVDNDYGIVRTAPANDAFNSYVEIYSKVVFLMPFVSIGLFTWAIAVLFAAGIAARKKEAILAIPCIMIVLTLMIATPISNEFRYAYSLFTSLPVLLFIMFYKKEELKK